MVEEWGTGRRDYSTNVEEAVIPLPLHHQYRTFSTYHYDLRSYTMYTYDNEPIYGLLTIYIPLYAQPDNYILYSFSVELNTDILIKAYFGLVNAYTFAWTPLLLKYGYGKVEFKFPKGYLITKEDTQNGVCAALGFLPGGYKTTITASFLRETLVR